MKTRSCQVPGIWSKEWSLKLNLQKNVGMLFRTGSIIILWLDGPFCTFILIWSHKTHIPQHNIMRASMTGRDVKWIKANGESNSVLTRNISQTVSNQLQCSSKQFTSKTKAIVGQGSVGWWWLVPGAGAGPALRSQEQRSAAVAQCQASCTHHHHSHRHTQHQWADQVMGKIAQSNIQNPVKNWNVQLELGKPNKHFIFDKCQN